jgi:hypothetical protein
LLNFTVLSSERIPCLRAVTLNFDDKACSQELLHILAWRVAPNWHGHDDGHMYCDSILDRLAGAANTLETLKLVVDVEDDFAWIYLVDPITTLARFPKLKHLSVPHAFLIGGRLSTSSHPPSMPKAITSVLPPSIETVKVLFPSLEILVWVQEVLRHRSFYAKMHRLDFQCFNGYDYGYGATGATAADLRHDHIDVWDGLATASISYHFTLTSRSHPGQLMTTTLQ